MVEKKLTLQVEGLVIKFSSFVGCLLFASIVYAAPTCAPIAGIDGLFAPGRIVLVGEIHGTREMPALFTDLVCHGVAAGFEVTVGFEQGALAGKELESYIASQGVRADRVHILAPRVEYGDGSASEAMADAFEAVRKLAIASHRVHTFTFATKSADNAVYADNIAKAHAAAPHEVVLALMGATHAQIKRNTNDDEPLPLTGELLRERGIDLRSIYIDYTKGAAYNRGPDGAGVHNEGLGSGVAPVRTLRAAKKPVTDHDLAISVGEIHPSPPAR